MKTRKQGSRRLHRITIRERKGKPKNRALVGANAEILIDGKSLKGCTSVVFTLKAGGIANVTLNMIPSAFEIGSFVKVRRAGTRRKRRVPAQENLQEGWSAWKA